MKVSILNSHDNVGGAAKAAFRLYEGLRHNGVDVVFLARECELGGSGTVQLERSPEDVYIERTIQQNLINQRRTSVSNTFFSFNYGNLGEQVIEHCRDSDIINLHWIDHFISNRDLSTIVDMGKPVVWTLHDEKPFTGGCHYTAGCIGYRTACDKCHMLDSDELHLPARVLKEKIAILNNTNITVVSPSKWLAREAESSVQFSNARIEVIPNGVNTDVFRRLSKHESKIELGISPDAVVLQFGAQNGKATRKGFTYLLRAIELALHDTQFREKCDRGEVVILCLGQPDRKVVELPVESVVLGYVSDERQMSVAYSATDAFILPSIEDNLPNGILESMACGTHVIGFDTGGVSDIVNDENGSIVEQGDSEGLSAAIVEAVLVPRLRDARNDRCRSVVMSGYTLPHQAASYEKLFKDLVANNKERTIGRYDGDSYLDVVGAALLHDGVVKKMQSLEGNIVKAVKERTNELENEAVKLRQELENKDTRLRNIMSTKRWRFFDACQSLRKKIL